MTLLLIILLLTMLLAFGTIWFSRNWKFSALTCLMIGAICSVAYFYSLTQRGWPSQMQLPNRFVVLGVSVKEPHGSSGGAIYYWIRPIPSNNDGAPLNIQIPYSKQAHEQAREILQKLRNNQSVQAQRRDPSSDGSAQGSSRGGSGRGRSSSGHGAGGGDHGEGGSGSVDGDGNHSGGLLDRVYEFMNPRHIPNYQFQLVEPDALPPKDGLMEQNNDRALRI